MKNFFLSFVSLNIIFSAVLIFFLKHSIPWFGSFDFIHYHDLVISPFNNSVEAPFRYRIITPLLSQIITPFEFLFIDNTNFSVHNFFNEKIYSFNIYQSLILVNYFCLNLSFIFLYCLFQNIKVSEINFSNINFFYVFFLTIQFISPYSLLSLTGIVDGVSFLFITILSYFYRNDYYYKFFIIINLSIFQREIISILFLVYFFISDRKNYKYILACFTSLSLYFILIHFIYQFSGGEDQLSFRGIYNNLFNFNINFTLIKHIFMYNYPIILLIILLFLSEKYIYRSLIMFLIILIFGIVMGVGNNIGRIIYLSFPLFLLLQKNKSLNN